MRKTDILKLAVPKSVLLFIAGFAWFCVGTMLLVLAYSWLSDTHRALSFVYFGFGFTAALLMHHFVFKKIAVKNINRIISKTGRQFIFSFFTWKSYIIIVVMVTMGKLFRQSSIPKPYLAILYTAIGLALILSSLEYIRVFINEINGTAAPDTFHSEEK